MFKLSSSNKGSPLKLMLVFLNFNGEKKEEMEQLNGILVRFNKKIVLKNIYGPIFWLSRANITWYCSKNISWFLSPCIQRFLRFSLFLYLYGFSVCSIYLYVLLVYHGILIFYCNFVLILTYGTLMWLQDIHN